MHRRIFYFLLFLALCPVLLTAGTKGRIKGKVVDLQTGEALIGANVLVIGTTTGAATDASGDFLLQNLDAGVYQVRASYLGYQSITVSNVRVNADLTTYIDFELPSEDIQVGTVEIVAQKPLIQKDNTNAVRITSSDDIEALPVRGVNNIIALTAGVVVQNGVTYIRGGRDSEVGYYLEGISVTNPMIGGSAVRVSQDALEEIQVQAGGYTAEFGGANSGIVRQQLKTGGTDLKASFEYITDNVTFKSKDDAFDGEKQLGAHWWGYNEVSATLSGPIFDNRFKFFGNINYVYNRDSNPQPNPGINLGVIGDKASEDTVNFLYPAGAKLGSAAQSYTYSGTLTMDFNPIKLRFSGSYTMGDGDNGGGGVLNFLNTRVGKNENSNGAFTLKLTHVLSSTMYYELSGGYFLQSSETYDRAFGNDNPADLIWLYGDSVANAERGWTIPRNYPQNTGRYVTPVNLNVMTFSFQQDGTIPVNYAIFKRNSFSLNGALSFLIGKTHSFKVGGEYQQFTIRNWGGIGTASLAAQLNSQLEGFPNADPDAIKRQILITRGVNNYGYDVFGNEYDGSQSDIDSDAPHKPVFASAYIQDKIEYEDLVINAGLRFDYIDIDNLRFKDPTLPDLGIDSQSGEFKKEGWEKVPSFSAVSPRLGFSFPVTNTTFFHAQYGKFVQQPNLSTAYNGYNRLGFEIRGGFFIPFPSGAGVRPTRTTNYELGFTQQLTDFISFDITGYYKDIRDQVEYYSQPVARTSAFQNYATLRNGDYATTKGIEVAFNMRRYERLAVNASFSFQDARGTGSNPYSKNGVVGAPLDGVTVFVPKNISPLTYNNALRGNINIDYRFGANDGPAVLHEFGVSALMTFNSGHPYTRGVGGQTAETDNRDRRPIEAINSSTTPGEFQMDLRIDKSFSLFDKLSLNVYLYVINLFDSKNIRNVFLRTGSADDDAVISNPELSAQLIQTYGDEYVDLYKAVNIDYQGGYGGDRGSTGTSFLYGPPRQIRLGIRLEY